MSRIPFARNLRDSFCKMATLLPPSSANMFIDQCESRLTVHISCNNLKNMDLLSKSDPFAILFLDDTGASTRPIPPNEYPLQPAVQNMSSSTRPRPISSSEDDTAAQRLTTAFRAPSRVGAYQPRDNRWQKIGITETISNSLSAKFATSFEVPYFFERAQRLAVDLFDHDVDPVRGGDVELHRQDYLGSAEFSLPALVRARGQQLTVTLRIPDRPTMKCGTATVAVEEVSESKQRIHYDVILSNVPHRRGYGPVLTISRQSVGAVAHHERNAHGDDKRKASVANKSRSKSDLKEENDDGWITVYRSNRAVPGTAHSTRYRSLINDFAVNYEKLCRCSDDIPLRFDISYKRRGKHRTILSAQSSLREASRNDGIVKLNSTEPSCIPVSRPMFSLEMSNRRIVEDTTFLDYIIGGCEISLVIALDFTASNGDPSKRGTLHFCDSLEANEYETAIRAVGDILASYDTDQMFPVFGFGAKLPPDYSKPSHVFSIGEDAIVDGALQSSDNFCYTIDGVLNAYRYALYNVRLAGPTQFAEVVQAGADHARNESRDNNQAYTIMLIVTDGVINDVDQTLDALFQAGSLPFSIVIIGVGDIDFIDMNLLDGDDQGRERDIVQFVNYRQYKDTPEVLRSRVLEEIPRQFLQYMSQRNIKPLPPPDDDGGNVNEHVGVPNAVVPNY